MTTDLNDEFFETCGLRVLMALRRIIRSVDIYSRKLNSEFKITAPQLICLYSLSKKDGITLSALAKEVKLGISTVNGIVDRLEAKGLLTRTRSKTDRRQVTLSMTDQGRNVAKAAPALLQDRLADSLRQLPDLEQAAIALSLERVVDLMEANHLNTSPNLMSGAHICESQTKENMKL
jgi:DNA-binding MarR family transcriptional regulator